MKKLIIIFAILLGMGSAYAQDDCLLEQKAPRNLVIDQADILNQQQEEALENYLIEFSKETSNQILVVTVNSLCGYDKSEFTYTLGENWGVGQKDFNNGIVIMVKPHGKAGDRHTFIAVGYGLEGVIPDATAKRIVSNEMIPYFKQGDFYSGIGKSVQTLSALAKGEINSQAYNKKAAGKAPIFPIFFVLGIIVLVFFANVQRTRKYAVGHNMTFWAAMMLMSQTRHRSGGGWGNFNSGGGSFGGGFGGFGGGSFGGGGAGGSW